jgi:DNA polymerase-3 subunit gamma/tau
VDQLTSYWRDLMVLNSTGGQARDISLAPRHRDALTKQATALPLDTILAGLDILSNTRARMARSNHARVLVEMALVRLTRLEDLLPVGQLARWLGQAPAARTSPPPGTKPVEPPEGVKKKPPVILNGPPAANPPPTNGGPTALTEDSLPRVWEELLEQAGLILSIELRKANYLAISGPNTLVIRFPDGYTDARQHCQEPQRLQRIEGLLRKLTGQPVQLRIETTGGAASQAASETAAQPRADTTSPLPRNRRQRAEAEQEPLVRRALDGLAAQIVRIDDGFGAPTLPTPAAKGVAPGDEEA